MADGLNAVGEASETNNVSTLDVFVGSASAISTAALNGSVAPQGRGSPPTALWEVPVRVVLYPAGGSAPAASAVLTTDSSGNFALAGITLGSYDIEVKHSQAVSRKANAVSLVSGGTTTVSFGELLAGDADDNNLVNILDFSILRAAFGRSSADSGYDARANFDATNNLINILDFSVLRSNFGQAGPQTAASVAAQVTTASGPSPSLTATPSVTATTVSTVTPAGTVTPTSTPTAAGVIIPTPTAPPTTSATPTMVSVATPTPSSTTTAAGTPTPTPTATTVAWVDGTPTPTVTPTVAQTPLPTATPAATPTPQWTAMPTRTIEPSSTPSSPAVPP